MINCCGRALTRRYGIQFDSTRSQSENKTGDVKASGLRAEPCSCDMTDAGAERKESQTKRKRKISVDSGRLARTTC